MATEMAMAVGSPRRRGGRAGEGKGQRQRQRPCVLTVAGADPSAASGVHRDIATFEAFGCTGLAAITSVTAQNTSRFAAAEPVSPAMVSRQIGAVFDDCEVAAVKVGMVYDGATMAAVRRALLRGIGRQAGRGDRGRWQKEGGSGGDGGDIPVVADPVARSTTGGRLLDPASIGDYRRKIVPLAAVVTPNVHELGVLAGGGGPGSKAAKGAAPDGGEIGRLFAGPAQEGFDVIG